MTVKKISLVLLLMLTSTWVFAQHAGMLPVPENLQKDAARASAENKPLVIMFALPDCPFCKVVRRNYLVPLLKEGPENERPVIRELQITSRESLTGFDGMSTTQSALAKQYGVRMAPTLVFVDAHGELLVPPLVGGEGAFYLNYLDRAFADATKNLIAAKAGKNK